MYTHVLSVLHWFREPRHLPCPWPKLYLSVIALAAFAPAAAWEIKNATAETLGFLLPTQIIKVLGHTPEEGQKSYATKPSKAPSMSPPAEEGQKAAAD